MALKRVVLAAAAAAGLFGGAALASTTITYGLAGMGSGSYGPMGGGTTTFTDLPVTIEILGDTAAAFDDTTYDETLVPILAATLVAEGQSFPIYIGSDAYFASPDASNIDLDQFGVLVGTPQSLTAGLGIVGSGLVGYDGVSVLSSTPVTVDIEPGFTIDDLGSPTDVQFTALMPAFFAAEAPEPGAWALCVLGLAATGAALRRRHATTGARA